MNALNGINRLDGLGVLSPHLIATILTNRFVIEKVLKHSSNLKGLGFVEGKKIAFSDVVKMYNEGISESEIKAWIWYKQKQGVPMKQWSKLYKVNDSELPQLVKDGAMFVCGDDYLPLPVYSYGNMYDRKDQLIVDKETIEKRFGKSVYEKHLTVITDAVPKQISVTENDPRERPIIMAISEIARNKNVF